MDPHSSLLHLHAHVGRGRGHGRRQTENAKAAAPGLDPEQVARAADNQLQPRLAVRQSSGSIGGQLCPR